MLTALCCVVVVLQADMELRTGDARDEVLLATISLASWEECNPDDSDIVEAYLLVPRRREPLLLALLLFTNMSDYVGLNRIKSD